jgi:NTE family protein
MPTNYLSMVWRFVTGEMGLVTNDKLRNLLASHFPERISTFADIGMVELYITALDLEARRLHVFGIDRSESVLDAIMASCAVPFFLAPWEYRGHQYVDGALLSDLPVRVAIQRGATEIFAIDVGIRRAARWSARGVFRSMGRIMDAVASQQVRGELAWAGNLPDVVTHHVHLDAFLGVRMWDFSRSADMIEEGKRAGREHLQQWGLA